MYTVYGAKYGAIDRRELTGAATQLDTGGHSIGETSVTVPTPLLRPSRKTNF
ncbi:hypothetical protein BDK88_0175 [Natrinema hispanicum]|uniref:Uncharacterized protein n=1 Tax=Natrinema hispanicum TaxID=392421 RepID=A0A482YEV8_9EURY|nr:hypothetical protein BDK88_0175 [Natrinema hispanicum]